MLNHFFYNENIQLAENYINKNEWIEHDVTKISDMLNERGEFLPVNTFNQKHNLNVNFLRLSG